MRSRRAQVAAAQAEIGVDHADQGQLREVVALGGDLGADQDVDLALLTTRIRSRAGAGRRTVSEEKTAMRAVGKRARASSSTRSTPGPQAGEASRCAAVRAALRRFVVKPVRWQTSRPV